MKKPELQQNEILVALLTDKEMRPYWLILMPHDFDGANWETQMRRAAEVDGDLPNRIEQAMLWANHRDQFQQDWYWSNETHHPESGWAWYQSFGYGSQNTDRKDNEFRARAVRRVYLSDLEDTRPAYAILQEGGSSTEGPYLALFDSQEDANKVRKDCAEGAYRTTAPVEVPTALADHPSFCDVVSALVQADFEYPET